MNLSRLPIDHVIPQLLTSLSTDGAVVLRAEPGAGKTTRVAPAILDSGISKLADGTIGKIYILQPRRIAARAAAARICDERGSKLGDAIGYVVRHESKVGSETKLIVCTEGIFLRKLQDDPFLEDVGVVIFDEFHERSLDSDLALSMVRLVKQQVRPDLKIVVMSATLDCGPISEYLNHAPIVETAGRTFPVAVQYLQFPSNESIDRAAANGALKLMEETDGDVLVFLPGVGEIRKTQSLLEGNGDQAMIVSLYGEMSLEEQQAALRPGERQKIVLSTNIAETSLTIPGITAVVDSGLARVNRFDPHIGLNRLELTKISKASAQQRAGRAGRTAAGHCLRLWTEREHHMLADFEQPEILRVDLADCVLRLFSWGEKNLDEFPWYQTPPRLSLDTAIATLERLDAITSCGITQLGQQMSKLPVQPRLSRLLIEGAHGGAIEKAALCAALLSERSPFRRLDVAKPTDFHSNSDVIDRMDALEKFEKTGERRTAFGDISVGAAKQILRTKQQLVSLAKEIAAASGAPARRGHRATGSGEPEPASSYDTGRQTAHNTSDEMILRCIVSAFPDRVCKKRQPNDAKAIMVGGRGLKLADESSVRDADLFVAVELWDSGKADLIVKQASKAEVDWLPKSQISSTVDVVFDRSKERVVAYKRTRFCDLILNESQTAVPDATEASAVLAEAVRNNYDLNALVDDETKDYLARILCLREWLPELNLPDLGSDPWTTMLPIWCCGATSLTELKNQSPLSAIQSQLSYDQIMAIDREAPLRLKMPNGKTAKIQYEQGKPPVLSARIQEFFGMTETPRLAGGRVAVLVHLLAPNYRVQQITPDLASFWKNTYPEVRKELKGRYPKHAWPEDPLKVQQV